MRQIDKEEGKRKTKEEAQKGIEWRGMQTSMDGRTRTKICLGWSLLLFQHRAVMLSVVEDGEEGI